MHKLNLAFLTTLSTIILATGCGSQEEEEQLEEQEPVPDTLALAPDTLEEIGAGWTVRTPDRKACVFVPRSAVPEGQVLNVEIRRLSAQFDQLPGVLPPGFENAVNAGRQVFPPVYSYSVTDTNQQSAQFADSVVFAMCVHHEPGELEGARLARDDGSESLEELPIVQVPAACQLRCTAYAPTDAALWMNGVLGGSPWTPTSLQASMAQTGLGGKGRTTSPFAAVR